MNCSTIGVMLSGHYLDEGVVGQMQVMRSLSEERKESKESLSSCHRRCHQASKCPPATQTQSILREQPSPSNATPETSWLERDGTAPWFLSLNTKPNIKRYQLRYSVLLPYI